MMPKGKPKDEQDQPQATAQPVKEYPPTPYQSERDLEIRLEHAGLKG